MTTATSTKKPRLTAAQKREAEAARAAEAARQEEQNRIYKAEGEKLVAANAELIAEQVEVFVKTAAQMINHVVENYKPRHKWFRMSFECTSGEFGLRMEDEIVNTIRMDATFDGGFKINHSMCGGLPVEQILEFSAGLTETANLCTQLREIAAPVTAQYEKSSWRVRDTDRAADALDYRVMAAIAKGASPRIQDYLRLRLGK